MRAADGALAGPPQGADAALEVAPGRAAVERDHRLGRVGRGRAGEGGDVVDQGRVALVADRADHRHPQHRHGAAEGLVAEGPEVGEAAAAAGDEDRLDLGPGGEVLDRGRDRRRGAPVLDRREGPDDRPRPAAALEAGEQVAPGGAALGGDDADRLRQRRARQLLLQLEQALGPQLLAQRLEPGQEVALAGEPDVRSRGRRSSARPGRRPGSSRGRR